MNKKLIINRMIGALLIYVLVFPSVILGYSISAKFNVLSTSNFLSYILVRLTILGLGLLLVYKILRPYSEGSFIAIKPGSNFLFDEMEHPFKKVTFKIILGIVLSSFLIGIGAFGFITLLAKLFVLIYNQ